MPVRSKLEGGDVFGLLYFLLITDPLCLRTFRRFVSFYFRPYAVLFWMKLASGSPVSLKLFYTCLVWGIVKLERAIQMTKGRHNHRVN